MAHKGFFRPLHPEKYKGNPTHIVYRSGWELRLMSHFDMHPHVIEWQSEELAIPYRSVIDGRRHLYFPDFKVKYKDKDGRVRILVIEVKPRKERIPPQIPAKKTKKYINEVVKYGKNVSKWRAAEAYCKERLWEFKILDEYELGLNINGRN